jgi:arylsulfatase A-like enzyme
VPWDSQPRSTYDQDKWELYNTADDFSCAIDVAAKYPEKLKEMQAAFLTEKNRSHSITADVERHHPLADRFLAGERLPAIAAERRIRGDAV